MIKKVFVEKVKIEYQDKNGKEYLTKTGNPYGRGELVTSDNQYISFFVSNDELKEKFLDLKGKEVELDITENGKYLNAKFPTGESRERLIILKRLSDLEQRINLLENRKTLEEFNPVAESLLGKSDQNKKEINTLPSSATNYFDEEIPFE